MSNKLTVYWFGYGGSSWMAERLRGLIEDQLGMQLVTIHEHPNANIPWDLSSVYLNLSKADIIIVPANFKRQPHKSNNRVTQAMALGKPIICEPLPAYLPIVKNLENGIILTGDTEGEWKFALTLLRDNANLRETLGKNALKTSKHYSRTELAKKWLNLLSTIPSKKEDKNIDVVIPTKKNISILKECLKSFKNSNLDETIYIIDNDCDSSDVEKLVKELGLPYEVRGI